MKVDGQMTNRMVKGKKNGPMEQHLKVNTSKEGRKALEKSIGQIVVQYTKASSVTTLCMALDSTNGQTGDSIMVIGKQA